MTYVKNPGKLRGYAYEDILADCIHCPFSSASFRLLSDCRKDVRVVEGERHYAVADRKLPHLLRPARG